NSVRSGPTSLESAGPTKTVIPQASATTLSEADYDLGLFGRSGEPLTGEMPRIDPATGTFSGPMPPTDLLGGQFAAFAPQLLPEGAKSIQIDSIWPGYYPSGVIGQYFMR